jgi:hypothetical protein
MRTRLDLQAAVPTIIHSDHGGSGSDGKGD